MTDAALEALAQLFASEGMREYFGEAVTVSQHMLQAGALAESAEAPDKLVAAALLHDVGHVLSGPHQLPHVPHERLGADWLSRWLPDGVTEPIRLHVAAKRYLCARQPAYFAMLSAASVQSLEVQGGPMSEAEAAAFEASPYASAAIAVRRWDEAAKDPSAASPAFDHFRPLLGRLLSPA